MYDKPSDNEGHRDFMEDMSINMLGELTGHMGETTATNRAHH